MTPGFTYRPEIDGLRAVAVLPVILFHAGFGLFRGGFAGVDVFFVISGYLITSIIVKELEAGTFTFRHFYERRARRILPALILVLAACLPVAWLVMLPMDMRAFASSVLSTLYFASNLLFWRQSGYFDQTAEMKPLLHTWSLSVEEQFYLLFPMVLLLLWKTTGRARIAVILAAVALISFIAADQTARHYPAFAFYWLPTRAWELLAGALCAFARPHPHPTRDNILSGLGLAAVVGSVFLLRGDLPFPSVYALPPVLGACAIILFAHRGTLAHRLLSSGPAVGIGLISYSAYLWHQPLFAFYRHHVMGEPGTAMALALAAAALILAALSWRFVERPFRQRGRIGTKPALAAAAVAIGALTLWAAGGTATRGYPQRYFNDSAKAAFLAYYENSLPGWQYFTRESIIPRYGDACSFYDADRYRAGLSTQHPRPALDPSCYTRAADKPKAVMIWGDSHAQMLRHGLLETLPAAWQLLQVASSGCPPSLTDASQPYCTQSNRFALDTIRQARPDVVILAQANHHEADRLQAMANRLKAEGVASVLILGPAPQWQYDLPWLIVKRYWNSDRNRFSDGLRPEILALDRRLRAELKPQPGVGFVSLIDAFCNESGCLAQTGPTRTGGLVTWDQSHLTPGGSLFLATQLLRDRVIAAP